MTGGSSTASPPTCSPSRATPRSDGSRATSATTRPTGTSGSGPTPTSPTACGTSRSCGTEPGRPVTDPCTIQAHWLLADHFGDGTQVYFAFNGTGTNVVGLQSLLRPHEAVICADTAHINVDECGAPERFLGSKLLTVTTPNGKLTPELAALRLTAVGDEHHVQARVVSITQSTELG